MIGLGALTKANAALMLPVAIVSALLYSNGDFWERLRSAAIGILIITVLCLPYYFWRSSEQGAVRIVGNAHALNSGLKVDNSLAHLTIFNPGRIIEVPFNNSWDDTSGRRFFWEFLYRSAFFGEFNFGDSYRGIASIMLFLGLFALAATAVGLWSTRIGFSTCHPLEGGEHVIRPHLPWATLLLSILVLHLAFRVSLPFSCHQDFRHSAITSVAFCYFIACAVGDGRSPGRCAMGYAMFALAVLCSIFVVQVYLGPGANNFSFP